MYDSCSDNCFAGICPSLQFVGKKQGDFRHPTIGVITMQWQYVGFGFGTFLGNETVADLGFNVDTDATFS